MAAKLDTTVDALTVWFCDRLRTLDGLSIAERCELLLAIADLGLDTPRIRRYVGEVISTTRAPARQAEPFLIAALRQMALTRFGAGEPLRRAFLDHWLNRSRRKALDHVASSFVVNLGLLNRPLLSPEADAWVSGWYARQAHLRSDRVLAWAPHCLAMAGQSDEARRRCEESLARRSADGSWGGDARRTAACAYALATSRIPDDADLQPSVDYLVPRFDKRIVDDVASKAIFLKLLAVSGQLPTRSREAIANAARASTLFVSYARADADFAVPLSEQLREHGEDVWLDTERIEGGEQFADRLADAINRCDAVLALLTESSVASAFCVKELLYAINKDKPILAVTRLTGPLPDKLLLLLGDAQWINGTPDETPATLAERLATSLTQMSGGRALQ